MLLRYASIAALDQTAAKIYSMHNSRCKVVLLATRDTQVNQRKKAIKSELKDLDRDLALALTDRSARGPAGLQLRIFGTSTTNSKA